MPMLNLKSLRLSNRDLDFLIDTVCPEVTDKFRLKQIIREDEDFRHTFVGAEKVFKRVMDDDEIFLRISPTLFFEVLLSKAAHDLEEVGYTVEKTTTMKVPVFDSKDVVELLTKENLLGYLADMLSSFTRTQSYTISFRVKKGTWKKIRFSDLDIQSLMTFCEAAEDEYRLSFYKRIADICLFILGIFPEYVAREYRYPFSRELRPPIAGKVRISPEDYEEEGRRFYKLAAEHQSAKAMDLSQAFWALHGNFQQARKPLNFIAEHYLQHKIGRFFG